MTPDKPAPSWFESQRHGYPERELGEGSLRLQDIGEQLARIRDRFPEFYEQHQQDSWHKLIGLRNVISHGYREVELDTIWDIVSTKLADFSILFKK